VADKLTDEQIEQTAREFLRTAMGAPDTDVGQARLRNLEYYNAEPEGELAPPEIEDRSDFVATDVADTVDGMLPQIMRMFVGSDDAVTFEGQGQPGSEQEAKLATAYVNHLFYVRNDGVGIVHDWFKDALLAKVGFAKVWAEEEADDAKQKYEGQTQEQLVMLLQDGWQLAEEPEADEQGLLNFTVRKESRRKCIKVMACPPSEMRIDQNARWGGEPAAIGQKFYRRRFELEQDGYDLSEVSGGIQPSDMEQIERLGEADTYSGETPHESHELFQYDECYIKLDADGDGVAEWLKVCLIEEKLAVYADGGKPAIEQVDDHPFVWICQIPRSHSFFGDCPADRAIQPQKLRTHTIRAIQDNMFLSVNQRMYINMRANVNIDDVLDSRPGGAIRGDGPASEAITPIVTPALGAPAYQFNEYIGSWAENRTGFNRYSAGTDQNALNKTARGTELLTAKADMRIELMARFFGVGMKQLFAKMLKLAIQHQNVQEMVAINGQFVPINPGEFRNQYHVKINIGLGSGSKEQQMARIMAVGQLLLGPGVQAGVVRPQHVSELIRLAVEANEFKNPERFVDAEPSGMPANPEQFKQMQEQIQEQMGQMQEQLQQLGQENQALKAEKASKEGDLAMKGAELQLKDRELSLKEHQAVAQLDIQERDQRMKGAETAQRMAQSADEESAVAQLQEQVASLTDVVMQIMQALQPEAPIES
jgi:hypothetical protein